MNFRIEDPNLQFKLLKIITIIIFPDKKDLFLKMDFIPKKSMKRIWIFNFPPIQTVCAVQCVEKYLKRNFFFFRYHLELRTSDWIIGYWFCVDRYCYYQVNWIYFPWGLERFLYEWVENNNADSNRDFTRNPGNCASVIFEQKIQNTF